MTKKSNVLMRVNVSGFSGLPTSMFCAYDPNTDVLAIMKDVTYEAGDRAGFLKITNSDKDEALDALVREEDFRPAILAYFELDALKLLVLKEAMQRANPTNRIERDKVDESGMNYRIAPDISNAQVGVLLAALYAKRQKDSDMAMDMADAFASISI